MTVQELIDALNEYPLDSKVNLATFLAASEFNERVYEITLHVPIIGLATNEDATDVRLVTTIDKHLAAFGTLRSIG